MIAIREYREKAGMMQAELAERCGVAKSTVSMWEIGARKPDIVIADPELPVPDGVEYIATVRNW